MCITVSIVLSRRGTWFWDGQACVTKCEKDGKAYVERIPGKCEKDGNAYVERILGSE